MQFLTSHSILPIRVHVTNNDGKCGGGRLDLDEIRPFSFTPIPSYLRAFKFSGKGGRDGPTEVGNGQKWADNRRAAGKAGEEVSNKLLHGTSHAERTEAIGRIVKALGG